MTGTRTIAGWSVLVGFCIVVAILAIYSFHFYRTSFNSDDAVTSMLAESMWAQGRLLPQGWIVLNGDLMVPSLALPIAFMLRWFANGHAIHAASSLVATALLLASLLAFLNVLKIPRLAALVSTTLVAYGFSRTFSEMVYQQATYAWCPTAFFLGATLIVMLRDGQSRRHDAWRTALLFFVVFSVSFANPGRAAFMLMFPLYAFDAVLRLKSKELPHTRPQRALECVGMRDHVTAVGLGGAFVSATCIYIALRAAGVTENFDSATRLSWAGWPSVWRHAVVFGQGWFYYLGIYSTPFAIGSISGKVIWIARALIAIALSVIGLLELLRMTRQRNAARRAVCVAFLGAFVPILLTYLLFEPLAQSVGTARYFSVPILILIVLLAFWLGDVTQRHIVRGPVLMACASATLVLLSANLYLPAIGTLGASFWRVPEAPAEVLARLLEREHLKWGYATWWNAGVTTVFSDSRVRVSPVLLGDGGVVPASAMVLKSWYNTASWSGETFVALERKEATSRSLDILDANFGPPARIVESPGFLVLVYGFNVAARFNCLSQVPMNRPLQAATSGLRIVSANLFALGADEQKFVNIRVRNEGHATLSGDGRFPLSIGIQLMAGDGSLVAKDWSHTRLSCALDAGKETEMTIALPSAGVQGERIRVNVLQEGVAWFQDWGVKPVEMSLQVASP